MYNNTITVFKFYAFAEDGKRLEENNELSQHNKRRYVKWGWTKNGVMGCRMHTPLS